MNAVLSQWKLPLVVVHFGSLWKLKFKEEVVYGELLFTLMRDRGIHIWDGFPCFLTEAHTHDEVSTIIRQFTESIQEMIKAGFFGPDTSMDAIFSKNGADFAPHTPPPDAKLGRDANGNPAWFIPNPALPGKYLQVKLN